MGSRVLLHDASPDFYLFTDASLTGWGGSPGGPLHFRPLVGRVEGPTHQCVGTSGSEIGIEAVSQPHSGQLCVAGHRKHHCCRLPEQGKAVNKSLVS